MPLPLALDEAVLAADALPRRARANRDADRESRALDRLIAAIADDPSRAFRVLADLTVEMIGAGSAGISLLEGDRFLWPAIAGSWAEFADGGLPIDASPCGVVIARDRALLFTEPHRVFPNVDIEPRVNEVLLVPLRFAGKPTGTLWAISHDDRQFDAEDARLLERLGLFAAGIEDAARSRARIDSVRTSARERMAYSLDMIRAVARRAADQPSGRDADAADALGERILAYAQAGLGAAAADDGIDLAAHLADLLQRHGERPGARVTLDGPAIAVPERYAGIVGLALREIVDNAFRHGALAQPEGRAEAAWRRDERGGVAFAWIERGVPLVLPRAVEAGFGFDLLHTAFPAQTGGVARIAFDRDGLAIRLTLPPI